jgi:hypothetical protein
MKMYLITYGDDNLMATFQADDHYHAIEQFIDWAPYNPDEQENRYAITGVSMVLPIIEWQEDNSSVYVCGNDDSWFHSADFSLVTVPNSLDNADEIEDFIVNNREED